MTPGRRELLILGGAGLAAAAAGFLVGPALLRLRGDRGGEALAAASFGDLEGRRRRLADWRGKGLVCNFWATWCEPCREEIPLLVAAGRKYGPQGVQIVGIAIDNAAKVREFAEKYSISYTVLIAEADGLELMRQLGNPGGGLPYTVIADREGRVIHRKLGAFKAAELDGILGSMDQG